MATRERQWATWQPAQQMAQNSPAIAAKFQQAVAIYNEGKLAQAEPLFREIVSRAPRHAGALHLLGVIVCRRGRLFEGERLISQALAIKPDLAEALSDHGNALLKMRRPADALASYDRSLAIKPDNVSALSNRGLALATLKRFDEALAAYDRALAIKPDHADALGNRGLALTSLHRLDEAVASFDRALAIDPDNAEMLNDRGNALTALRRLDEALASYGRALAIKPDFGSARFNEGVCRLLGGDFGRGWEGYEWRERREHERSRKRNFSQPLWLGDDDIAGKTILLHAEQGLGDTIQFCRYASLVAARGARVVLEVQPALTSLLAGLDGAAQVVARGDALPAFDLHCPLMSLPLAFKTTLATVPAAVPYLAATADRVALWQARLGAPTAPRIGLMWAGNPEHKNDHHRSIAPQLLAPLLECGATLISLQQELRAEDRPFIAEHPAIRHFGNELRDFADTASLVALMDVVISVDTSVAHLAGALGRPLWVLLPFIGLDWRWLLHRDDSPWYSTARLFRQPAMGDWESVIARVAGDLRA